LAGIILLYVLWGMAVIAIGVLAGIVLHHDRR
jgi:hypothetical protein